MPSVAHGILLVWWWWVFRFFFFFQSVKPLPRVFLLFLVDHDADDDTCEASQYSEQEEEEQLDTRHGAGLGVVDVVPRRLEHRGGRHQLGPVDYWTSLVILQFKQLHRQYVVVIRQLTYR